MGPASWPRMTLLGRIVLFLTAFGAAMALQIGIGYYQSKYVLAPLERRSESIQTISRFLNDVESCMTALENYRWDYGDAGALVDAVQAGQERSAGGGGPDHLRHPGPQAGRHRRPPPGGPGGPGLPAILQ